MSGCGAPGFRQMMDLIDALPEQLDRGAGLPGLAAALQSLTSVPHRIILCGMGGSAIAGDLVEPLIAAGAPTSLTVWREYGLPPWAAAQDLVLVSSYSGNTEETLSGLGAALDCGCQVVALSSGGRVAELARAEGFPWIQLPAGLPPRASLGWGLGSVVRIMAQLGLFPDAAGSLARTVDWLRQAGAVRRRGTTAGRSDPDGFPAVRELAGELSQRIAVILTAGPAAHGPGRRWQAQINENSKLPAWWAPLPEADHNALVGWTLPPSQRDRFVLLVLTAGIADERLRRRVAATIELIAPEFRSCHRFDALAAEPLARVMSLVQYGDFLSCEMAAARGVDPVPVERIERLKDILADPPP